MLLLIQGCSAQSPELKIALAGQIARALAVFCVDEVVIFDDGHVTKPNSQGYIEHFDKNSYTGYSNPSFFLMHILSYLETPPHLRRHLFPMHPDLKLAGALPSLDMPHHLRAHEWCRYREGITLEMSQPSNAGSELAEEQANKHKKKKQKTTLHAPSMKTLVESGLPQKVSIKDSVSPGTRVTLEFSDDMMQSKAGDREILASAVAPSTPREEAGYYWGYSVRPAPSVSAILTECPYDGGYDLTFGTSERGIPISSLIRPGLHDSSIPSFTHMLVCFGGVAGLEVAVKADEELAGMGISEPKDLFDYWVNLCPGQGSRTIRTEEAVWLGLMGLREVVVTKGQR